MTQESDYDPMLGIDALLEMEEREPYDDGTLAALFLLALEKRKPTNDRLQLAMLKWLQSLDPTYFKNRTPRGRPTTKERDEEIAFHYLELKDQGKRHIRKFLARQWQLPIDTIDKIITTHARHLSDTFEVIKESRQHTAVDDWFRERRAIRMKRWSGTTE